MYILLYVTTFITLLASLTYVKMAATRSIATSQMAYHHYMQASEQEAFANSAHDWYKTLKVNSKTKDEGPKEDGLSSISLFLFINKDQDRSSDIYRQTRELLKHTILDLYKDQDFFKKAIQERASLVDELIEEIEFSTDQLSEDDKIKRLEMLTTLPFRSRELHHLFFLMLEGVPKQTAPLSKEITPLEPIIFDTDDEDIIKEESSESHSPSGNISLLDVVSIKKSKKVRVFLASRTILNAIYEDPSLTERIIERRRELYKQVRQDSSRKDELTKQFQEEFAHAGRAQEFSAILNFAVTNTDPKK